MIKLANASVAAFSCHVSHAVLPPKGHSALKWLIIYVSSDASYIVLTLSMMALIKLAALR